MKKILFLLMLLGGYITANACGACQAQQPKVLRGISHGAGPQSNWDLLIVSVTAVIVLGTAFFSLKWLVWPGEKEEQHIKRTILNYK